MKIIMILILNTVLIFASPKINYYRQEAIDIIENNNIDIDGKSIKGWIRIFNSEEKTSDYGFKINNTERNILLLYMKQKNINKMKKYKRSIK